MNRLTILFDDKDTKLNIRKINKYLEVERKINKLNTINTSITNYVYGENEKNNKNKPTLHLGIKKNGEDFIHLTIHLSLEKLKDDSAGMIHIKKDIYKITPDCIILSNRKFKKFLYALIRVKVPENKPNSLEFSIDDQEFVTLGIKKECAYDSEIKKESLAIINVLNKLFDENNKEMFIGEVSRNTKSNTYNTRIPFPIHNKTNLILKGINAHTNHFTRKNKGSRMGPVESTEQALNYKRNRKTSFRAIREEKFKKGSKLTRKTNRGQPNKNPYTNTYNLSPNNINEMDS